MLTDQDGYKIIDQCLDNNVVVYDCDAKSGECTKRLIYYMKRNAPLITHVIMTGEVFIEFLPLDWNSGDIIKCFGIKLIHDERLKNERNDIGIWLDYYKKRSATLAHMDEFLLLGCNEDVIKSFSQLNKDNVIAGSC